MTNISNFFIKIIATIITIFLFIGSSSNISNANNKIENEFESVLEKYENNEVIVDNGIVLYLGEQIELKDYIDSELSNNDTIKINENAIVSTINTGTVFLSKEVNDKVHIIEIYVAEDRNNDIKKTKKTNRNYYKVLIDPGHGGTDPGASGLNKSEKQLNLEISKKVKSKLEARGIEVKLSRETDSTYLTLQERGDIANEYGADVFVSIHQNSATNTSANGIETYYHTDKQHYIPLSSSIQNNAIKETLANNRNINNARFGVLRASNMPSALFECGFISNETEAKKLESEAYQDKIATGIVNGIEEYLKNNIYLSGKEPNIIFKGTVTTTSLNVRSGYGTSNPTIGKLSKNEKIDIVDKQNGWYRIKYKDVYGYVSSDYVSIEYINNSKFNDIENNWCKDMINEFASKGYISGYSDGTFRPNNQISRAEFIKIVNRVYNLKDKSSINFEDLIEGSWEYEEVSVGVNAGYISTKNTKFRPNDPITREEACKIVGSLSNISGDGIMSFKDKNKISTWAKNYVDGLNELNIINGYGDGTFKPQNNINRAETVKILYMINKKI